MSSQLATKGDVMQRIGGIGLIVGGVLTIVGNGLVPRSEDPFSVVNQVKVLAENPDQARIDVFLVILGVWALMGGFAAVYRSIPSGAGSAWARLGFYGTVAATSIVSVSFALALATAKAAGAGEEATATSLQAATESVFGVGALAYWTAILFSGIGIAASAVYPKWIGWVLIMAGAVTAIVGSVPTIFDGSSQTTELVFVVGALPTSVMALVLGIIITRRQMEATQAVEEEGGHLPLDPLALRLRSGQAPGRGPLRSPYPKGQGPSRRGRLWLAAGAGRAC